MPADVPSAPRAPLPTLTGLGDEPLGASATPSMVARWRKRRPDDSGFDSDLTEDPPPRPPERSRPETLRDDLDDELARSYLEQAEHILASGVFASAELLG